MILHDGISRDEVLYKREHFRRSIQKSAISKKQNTDRRFLKELMASYEQKKELKQCD